MKKRNSAVSIRKDMPILEIVTLIPEAKGVLAEYGLHCFSCAGSEHELLADGCRTHGFTDEDIDELVDDLNELLDRMPGRPQTLTLTADGAHAIGKVAADEGRKGQLLEVIVDASGGFCMEFRSSPLLLEEGSGVRAFCHSSEPSIRIIASPLTLKRIGGATIDFREGRFKLDLPEDEAKTSSCCQTGGQCSCN